MARPTSCPTRALGIRSWNTRSVLTATTSSARQIIAVSAQAVSTSNQLESPNADWPQARGKVMQIGCVRAMSRMVRASTPIDKFWQSREAERTDFAVPAMRSGLRSSHPDLRMLESLRHAELNMPTTRIANPDDLDTKTMDWKDGVR